MHNMLFAATPFAFLDYSSHAEAYYIPDWA